MKNLKNCVSALSVLILLAACSGGGGGSSPAPTPTPTPTPTNSAPTASAGSDISQSVSPQPITLDGSASSDPDGDTLSFEWSILSRPTNGDASLSNGTTDQAGFSASVPGTYTAELTVTDPSGASDTDAVTIELSNDAPVINIDAYDETVQVDMAFMINAGGSSDDNGHSLTFNWVVLSKPAASDIETEYSGPSPEFIFDVVGEYQLELTVSDGYGEVSQTLDEIRAEAYTVSELQYSYGPTNSAVFHPGTETILAVNERDLIRLKTDGTEETLRLPLAGSSVAISPDGESAVVGHNGWVSWINLQTFEVTESYTVSAEITDVEYGANDIAYARSTANWGQSGDLIGVDLTNGTQNVYRSHRGNVTIRMHPSLTKLYETYKGYSPIDIIRYSVSDTQVTESYDSPYHGDFPFCGDIWMGPQGNSILTPCGVVVRSTDVRSSDLTYIMQLDTNSQGILHASSSGFSGLWYTVHDNLNAINQYDATTGELLISTQTPLIDSVSTDQWTPVYVFASEESDNFYVLAEDTSATTSRFALLKRGDASPDLLNRSPKAVAQKYTTALQGNQSRISAGQSFDPEGEDLTYSWRLVTQPEGSNVSPSGLTSEEVYFTPSVSGTYEFELIVNDGDRNSAPTTTYVNVFAPGDAIVHRLDGGFADLEYNASRNIVVYLSDQAAELRIVDLDDYSERRVPLQRLGYRVGISTDGRFAAVSHSGMASLVDLIGLEVVDTQSNGIDWGDIVLDSRNVAHSIPYRDQWVEFTSIDFANNLVSDQYGARAGTEIRLHPNNNWVYGADRGLSPSDFEKWDISSLPPTSLGDSPYHGDYSIAGNIWISEDGLQLLTAGGNSFRSRSDPDIDMTYRGKLEGQVNVAWGDHSSETDQWMVVELDQFGTTERVGSRVDLFDDQFLTFERRIDIEPLPGASNSVEVKASHAWFNDTGTQAIVALKAEGTLDARAIQISDID